ncbi:MAG: hypothetical protein JW712_04995 [Dehalococcoidales bacterium]|nr:hypothetical protein [Dehalococcoidales bacterium]
MNTLNNVLTKHRWLVSLVIIAIVGGISALIITGNEVFPMQSSQQTGVAAVSDGSGGVITTMHNNSIIYAQRYDSSGQAQWGKEGVFITECPLGSGLTLDSDGQGGASVSWYDNSSRPDDRDDPAYLDPVPFYCRRITSDGEVTWSSEPVSTGNNRVVVPDKEGGAVIAWDDYTVVYRGLWDNYLRVQKIAPDGSRLWGDEGVLVVTSSPFRSLTNEEKATGIKGTYMRSRPTYSGRHEIVGDGTGGVFIFWDEEQDSGTSVYAQYLNDNGEYLWPGKILVADNGLISGEQDVSGRAIVTVLAMKELTGYSEIGKAEIYVDRDGTIQKTGYIPYDITMSDGTGGTFGIDVEQYPSSGDPRLRRIIPRITRLDGSRRIMWEEKEAVPGDGRDYTHMEYLANGEGGIITVWDIKIGTSAYTEIRARKLDANGNVKWSEQGVTVFQISGAEYQQVDSVISDGSGGVIVVGRLGNSALREDMVYLQRIDNAGNRMWGGGIRID